jgi:serine/threonine protein kinase
MEGVRIGGYRVLRQIGEGGMGTVWMAKHNMIGRHAAIKILRPEYSVQRSIVARFFNEARAATAISDPGIIQIFDFGYHTDGSAYLVMELLSGEPLDRRLKRLGVLPVGNALRLCRQVASAIGAAHAGGIIHRDLKPENIFIVRDSEVPGGERAKVLDFGIAKLAGDLGTHHRTEASAILGTPTFMSPEQCRGAGEVGQQSDVYSLGCVLFMLVTGRPPFDTKAMGTLIMQHMVDPPPCPSTRMPAIPAEVDDLILRCLAKSPADRFATGAEFALAIDALLALPSVVNATTFGPVVAATLDAVPTVDSSIASESPPTYQLAGQLPGQLRGHTTLDSSGTFATRPLKLTVKRSRARLYSRLAEGAVIVGGLAVTVVALQSPTRPPEPAPTPSTSHPVLAATKELSPPTADPRQVRAKEEIHALLAAFSSWAKDRAGAPCPTSADLGGHPDPWGNAYELTCTNQPADQIIGVRSMGPDGAMGTDDDLVSWALDRDMTALVRGTRWAGAQIPAKQQPNPMKPAVPAVAQPQGRLPSKKSGPSNGSNGSKEQPDPGIIDTDGDGIPDSRQ